jgi:hypothetical protein
MSIKYLGIIIGVVSILISLFLWITLSKLTPVREYLYDVNIIISIVALIVNSILHYLNRGKITKWGFLICIIAILLSIGSPNYIVARN